MRAWANPGNGLMAKDNELLEEAFVEDCELTDDKRQRRTGVIAKLVGARCEVEDVLLSAAGSTVLTVQERVNLSFLMKALDNIVQRIEEC